MLTELYFEALLANADLADRVWYMWDAGIIDDELAAIAWWLVLGVLARSPCQSVSADLMKAGLTSKYSTTFRSSP